MTLSYGILRDKNLDNIYCNLSILSEIPELHGIVNQYLGGDYATILQSPTSKELFQNLVEKSSKNPSHEIQFRDKTIDELLVIRVFIVGLSAFNAFLQANVTGPFFDWQNIIPQNKETRTKFLGSLDVNGVSVYQNVSYIELYCLARLVFLDFFPYTLGETVFVSKWISLRINIFHQRLLFHSCGGSLRDSNLLLDVIDQCLIELDTEILGHDSKFSTKDKIQYLLERAQIYITQGFESKAKKTLKMIEFFTEFTYALSGALGKRTKFQETDISQLVVFAKSKEYDEKTSLEFPSITPHRDNETISVKGPQALQLNDDTLLESIAFLNQDLEASSTVLPSRLAGLKPDDQPQLNPLDQITLLLEATLKDKFSPPDDLRSEEILPYATRVLNDKPTNWQIYTQALLVRSRIELHRSRTIERSILQLQAIVDQIVIDTQETHTVSNGSDKIPDIKITSFLPKPKLHESASVQERLQYVFALNTPSRWELESELAFAWAGAGSFASALNIFKRLELWAEIALCYNSISQEGKARQIIRRQLYFSKKGGIMDQYDIDAEEVAAEKWDGELRPIPPHAPRLWCILGDLDNEPSFWEHAWEISQYRYARAQRSLGEYFIKSGSLKKAREAYSKASSAHRQNPDTWSRLGDLDLKLENWESAIYAFQQSIMLDDTDAMSYSNLGSALLSKHTQLVRIQKSSSNTDFNAEENPSKDEVEKTELSYENGSQDSSVSLRLALRAYKRAANLAHTNWKMWDNVVTISLRISPPSYNDLLLALQNIVRIRAPTLGENAIDIDALACLITEVTSQEYTNNCNSSEVPALGRNIYAPPRGSLAYSTLKFIDEDIHPLLTSRSELYELMEKMALYQKNYTKALDFSIKAWRCIIRDEVWLTDEAHWAKVVESTVRVVDAFQNYGSMPRHIETVDTNDVKNNDDNTDFIVEPGWCQKAKKAIKSVLGKAHDTWDASEGWDILQRKLKDLSCD
ncbi:TPR repeat-containing protein C19B12.01 [Erysiphe neolycopersici]|uniref:TPR repeat-containing protein C19B12.01 n=1 Tax=Erysiphe neolycopersici TaxID=212602 RepID=A0A420I1K9_9PEZI|nr:TPR repeat-containing protein C19B12.01 [Erysiphe neolycopersici]